MSSRPPSSQPPPSQAGYIHLILLSQENPFYLEIPTAFVGTVCLKPLKYLKFLGWCILGVSGVLKDGQGNEMELDGELVDQGVYHYIVPDDKDALAHAVDLEVIKKRSDVPSETTGSREDFRTKLFERDGRCVWTGLVKGTGMHIIPYARGDEWLQLIVENRPHDEILNSLTINDIQNGIYGIDNLYNHYFDPRDVIILKTPNPVLQTTDVPNRHQRNIAADVSYPTDSRYTLQWIAPPDDECTLLLFPNNNDATFMDQQMCKPADLLLHYNYGAAAVKQWGKNISVLADRPDIPRPASVLVPATMKQASVGKRKRDGWDEDDVMLFFWGNSKAARERHAQKEQERTVYLENWRAAVAADPDVV